MKKPIINLEDADREVVGSDCMCELGSDEHERGCQYTNSEDSTHTESKAYQNTIEELSKEHDLWKDAKETSLTFGKGFIFDEKEWWLNKVTKDLNTTREEVVEQWRKSIDEEGLSCARKIEEAVREERERIKRVLKKRKYKPSGMLITAWNTSIDTALKALQQPLPDKE